MYYIIHETITSDSEYFTFMYSVIAKSSKSSSKKVLSSELETLLTSFLSHCCLSCKVSRFQIRSSWFGIPPPINAWIRTEFIPRILISVDGLGRYST